MTYAVQVEPDHPILIDKFLENAVEVDVDAIADHTGQVVIGGIMEHIEQAGIHSGDSACSLPTISLPDAALATIRDWTVKLAKRLNVIGLMNIPVRRQGESGLHSGGQTPVPPAQCPLCRRPLATPWPSWRCGSCRASPWKNWALPTR